MNTLAYDISANKFYLIDLISWLMAIWYSMFWLDSFTSSQKIYQIKLLEQILYVKLKG